MRIGSYPGTRLHRRHCVVARALALTLPLLATSAAGAEEIFLEIDPSRSHVSLAAGSQTVLPLPQNFSGFGFGDQLFPHLPQPGLPPGSLPNGAPSDGRSAGLGGLLRVDVGDPDAPTQIRFVRESSSIALLPSGSWRPGVPPAGATATGPAALAVRFGDADLGAIAEVALRAAALSVASASAAPLSPTGPDAWSFGAGCSFPDASCPELRIEEATFDAAVNEGMVLRRGFRSTPVNSPAGAQGTLARTESGELELTLPIEIQIEIGASDLLDPTGSEHTLVLSGQLVAVPEPAATWLGLAALLGLASVAAARFRRARSVRTAALVLLAGLGTSGCELLHDEFLDTPSFYSIACVHEFLAVRKNGGTQDIFVDDGSQPCSGSGRAFTGTFDGVNFELLSKISYQLGTSYASAGITVNPMSAFPADAEIDYRTELQIDYGASAGGGSMQMFFGGYVGAFGAAQGEARSGWVEIGESTYPLDGVMRLYDLDPLGGSLSMTLRLDANRRATGKGHQAANLQFGFRPSYCGDNKECAWANPSAPVCGGDGFGARCRSGGIGSSCTHSAQCEGGMICLGGSCLRNPLRLRFDF